MKRILMIVAALASVAFAVAPSPAQARTSVGISVNIGDPYRGASFRFQSAPDLVLIPATRVYYVDNYDDYYGCDVYRYGSWWYLVDDGYWYRSRSYSGPFYAVDYDYVPQVFFSFYNVPTRYHSHWGGSFAYRSGNWNWYRGRSYPAYGTYYRYRDGGYRTYRDRVGYTSYRDRSYYNSGTRDSWSRDRIYNRDQAPTRSEQTWTRDRTYNRDQAPTQSEQTWTRDRTSNREAVPTRSERTWTRDRSQERSAPSQDGNVRNRDQGPDNGARDNGNRGEGRGKGNKGGRGHGRGNDK